LAPDGRLLYKAVVPTAELPGYVAHIGTDAAEAVIAIGDGTSSKEAQAALREALPAARIVEVTEAHSTERALERWRDLEAPCGWRRFVPRSLRFPPGPVDDYAAWVLAEDYLRRQPKP